MLDKQNTIDTLNAFTKYVVQQSRTNLTKTGKNASKALYESIKGNVNLSPNSFQMEFEMLPYGKFQDKGVKGVGGTKANGHPWKMKNTINTPYSYKDKMPPPKAFDRWVIKRGIAPRTKKGTFADRDGIKFAIAKSIYHTGIETTNFFTKPFEMAYAKLPDEVIEAYGLDVETFLKYTLR